MIAMYDFEESIGKQLVRETILKEATKLNEDSMFVYFGLPGRNCIDIKQWKDNIKYAYCCENDPCKYSEMQRRLHRLIPGKVETFQMNIWERMCKKFDYFVDICNFDFYGGPSSSPIPEISEFSSLSNFFSNQRNENEGNFLIAWTLGVRNPNFEFYRDKTIEFIKEIYPKESINFERLKSWLSEPYKKMIRNYIYFIPCITAHYAYDNRYHVELIDSRIYKKIMYFGFLKLIPSDKIISKEERHSFFSSIFEGMYPIYDKRNRLDRIEYLKINDFLVQ